VLFSLISIQNSVDTGGTDLAGETYSFRFFDSNIWYLKFLILYKHLKHIQKHNGNSRFFIIMLWKAQMQCLIEIVVSQ